MVVETLGRLQTASLQTLTNGLCETTAIDIYLISPHPSTVSTNVKASYHPLSVLSSGMGDAMRTPPPSLHTSFLLPWGGREKKEQERESEREGELDGERKRSKKKASGVVKEHTRLSVFTCLPDEV